VNIAIEPGTYVVAVSGGVDSVALLHALSRRPDLKLVVAHYDHGIRHDSHLERKHVQQLARQYRLPFVYDMGSLGSDASEDEARRARYAFLDRVRATSGARGVITAHHKNDVLETAVLQLLRGTGRRGLSALRSRDVIHRPLLGMSKLDIQDYARSNGLVWREDSTNQDTRYLRNHVRHAIVPRMSKNQEALLHMIIDRMHEVNHEIDQLLDLTLHMQPGKSSLSRSWFTGLPHSVAMEVMAHWLRRHDVRSFDRKHLYRLVVGAKTLAPGQQIDINKEYVLKITKNLLALMQRDR